MKTLNIAQMVLRERQKKGLSQQKAAKELGISAATLRSWEENEKIPTRANKAKIKLWIENGQVFQRDNRITQEDEEISYKDFGHKILKMRIKYNITQSQMALELEISPAAIHRWENGQTIPSAFNMERLREWQKGRDHELKYYKQDETPIYTPEVLEVAPKVIKKPVKKIAKKEVLDEDFGDLSKAIFEDFGNQKAPWELPLDHPKRIKYEERRKKVK